MADHGKFTDLARVAGPKLIPFLIAVCMFFVMDAHKNQNEYWSTILKCAPIISLIAFIILHDISFARRWTYTNQIFFGLIFSCLGDALLNHNYFPHGMSAFAVAQLFYISAFGFQPLKLWIGCCLHTAGSATVMMLWKNLSPVLSIGLPIYTILLVTMCWRSLALLFVAKKSNAITRLVRAIAAILFVTSDTMIAINAYHTSISNSSVWIMGTYYVAQFGITITILDADQFNNSCKQSSSKKPK